LVCRDFFAYATTITRHPISSRESACACPPWYASLVGVVELLIGWLSIARHGQQVRNEFVNLVGQSWDSQNA
jgi:hypothetical protein